MVAKIISGKHLRGILSYNENKVGKGAAELLSAENFTTTAERLSFPQKLTHFEKLVSLNTRTKTNAVHISLNFDPSEKLSRDTLIAIAKKYMEKIGFGGQPFLVYQHFDAAHPHLHIVTTNIETDSNRIDLHNIGRNQSETARKELEKEYNLVPAESKTQQEAAGIKPADLKKALYGQSETKQAISNIVRSVTKNWKYSSLHELNAILRQYNVTADRGNEGSKLYDKKGLVYRLLDEEGKKVGVPIKASAIYGQPTLPYLEKRYALNEALKKTLKELLKAKLNQALANQPTQAEFEKRLAEQGVKIIYRQSEDGRVYGATFTDHEHKAVFNGSDLGKAYSGKTLTEGFAKTKTEEQASKQQFKQPIQPGFTVAPSVPAYRQQYQHEPVGRTLLEAFLDSRQTDTAGMMPKRRKRKRKRQHL